MKQEQVDVLIIGAGPSGCVSAAYLHNNGVNVRVIEKTKFDLQPCLPSLYLQHLFNRNIGLPRLINHRYL